METSCCIADRETFLVRPLEGTNDQNIDQHHGTTGGSERRPFMTGPVLFGGYWGSCLLSKYQVRRTVEVQCVSPV